MKKLVIYLFLTVCSLLPVSLVQGESNSYVTSQQKETVVYITRTGQKYHRAGCRYLSQSQIKITKSEAIKNRYGACKVCKP